MEVIENHPVCATAYMEWGRHSGEEDDGKAR